MQENSNVETMIAGLSVGVTRSAKGEGIAKLTPLHRELVQGMPAMPEQEVRVLFATLLPGDVTPYHSHRFPVTVYMTEGTFTLDLDDREPTAIEAGQVLIEPAGVAMTGRNKGDVPARMVLFYVCQPGVPFADQVWRNRRGLDTMPAGHFATLCPQRKLDCGDCHRRARRQLRRHRPLTAPS